MIFAISLKFLNAHLWLAEKNQWKNLRAFGPSRMRDATSFDIYDLFIFQSRLWGVLNKLYLINQRKVRKNMNSKQFFKIFKISWENSHGQKNFCAVFVQYLVETRSVDKASDDNYREKNFHVVIFFYFKKPGALLL